MQKNSNKIVLFLTVILALFSCRKDFEQPEWDVDLLAPLVKTTLNIGDLLPDSVLQTNPDTSLKIVYETSIFDVDMDSLFRISDTTINEVFPMSLSVLAAPGDAFYSVDREVTLNVTNNVQLNYALVESGFIEIEIWSEIQEQIIVTYTIPTATKNGDTLVLTELIPAGNGSQPGYFTTRIDISDYELNLTGINNNKVNTFVTRAVAVVDTNATQSVLVSAGQEIAITNKLVDVVPAFVRGYFGNQQFRFGPESTTFDVFNRISGGTLDLDQVNVNLTFENGIGVDARLTINQLEAVNTNTSTNSALNHTIIGNAMNINRAQRTFSVPEVNYTTHTTSITTANSNIDQMIELFPNELIYDISLHINPLGNISGNNDFVFKKHPLKTNLNVEFPLSLIANQLTLTDTTEINLRDENKGNIIDGDLILYAENGFPFDATISLSLLDASNNQLVAINSLGNILAAALNSNLRATTKKSSKVVFQLSEQDIIHLYNTENIVVNVSFTTIGQPQFIKIYEDYELDLKVVGDFSYTVNAK
ncbi:MAG: hypothetical protein CMD31_05325 [Flavobacteriales bacterium]|nr:hypothetical protein [Flavobacteriales bacterium]|tara:strand:- start:127698 stop:129299 length:1602 start_codon:yes stop_codon:yes gene_type:complete